MAEQSASTHLAPLARSSPPSTLLLPPLFPARPMWAAVLLLLTLVCAGQPPSQLLPFPLMPLSTQSRDDADALGQAPRSPAPAAAATAMQRGSMSQLREARGSPPAAAAAAALGTLSPVAGQPVSPAFSGWGVASSPSARAPSYSTRAPPKFGLGLSSVRESTLLLIWRFVVNLKRRVASLVKSLHAKSAHIRSLLLARFPQLSRVPPMLLGQLCLKSQKKLFQRKYTLVQQGQISEWIYIVQMGALAVYQQSEHVIATAGGSTAGVGGGYNEMNASSDASVAAASAAAGKRFEALHLADIHAGDEVGVYGLLRPPTIVLVGAAASKASRRRKKSKAGFKSTVSGAKGSKAAGDSSSDSDDAGPSRKKGHHRGGSSIGGGDDWRGGYPQPHTVIASQPSIVYALSARLFREVLLSVCGLYEEVRTELTDKYLLRLKRFELWEIGRMRMQKIKQIQQTLVEAATKGKAGTVGGRSGAMVDAAAVRASFEQAEAIVARDSIADLFHGQKKMFQTMSALSGVRDIHALHSGGESSDGDSDEEIGRGGFLISGALPTDEGEVLLSQWNEKQTGALDKAHGSLSLDAPHHPPPNYKHVSILAQIHADKAGPPIPFVDTRRLVGSRRVYDLHANAGGAPTRHLITPSAKPSVSALALKAQGTEAQQQLAVRAIQHSQGHSLPPLTDATSLALLAHSGSQPHPALGLSLAAVDAATSGSSATAAGELDASGGFVAADGSYISAEELTYQKRLAKLQAKADRKATLKRTAEEEKFLEDILLVSKQVQEMNATTHKIQRIEANKAAAELARERSGQAAAPASPSSSSGRISELGQRKLPPSALSVASSSTSQQLPSSGAAAGAASRSPVAASSRSPLHTSASFPSLQLVVPASTSAAIATPTPVSSSSSSTRVVGLGKSASGSSLSVLTDPASHKQRNSFVSQPPDDFVPMLSPTSVAVKPPTHERRISSASAAGMLPGSPALGAMSPSGAGGFGGITLPAENPLYEHLPTLPSPQLKGLFALLKEHGSGGSSGGNAALYLLDTLAATKQLAALPTLPSDQPRPATDDPSSPAHGKKKDATGPRGDHLHKRGSVLLDVGSPLQKLRRASLSNAANAAASGTNSATASPQLGASSPLLDSMSPTHSGSLLAPSRHQRHTSTEGQGGGIADPSISVPAGYHSASFHTFSEEAWKGVTRCTTPPLLPPATEDPRVSLIRQGIERAQFRVKARGHQTSVGIKEFSRDLNNANKKRPHILPVNAVEAQRKEKSSNAAAMNEAEAGANSQQQHAASPTNSSSTGGSSSIGSLVHSHDNPLADLRQSRLSVLHLFSMHKARDRDYRALSQARAQAKIKAEQKAARKAAVQAAEQKKAARIERRRARLVDPGLDAPDLLAPGRASSSSSSSDDDSEEDGDEGDDQVPGTLQQQGQQHRKHKPPKSEESKQQQPSFSPSQLLPQLPGSKDDPLLRRHDTFLSPHHQRATHGSHAMLLEEQEVQRARARREHMQRLELLQTQKLKPAPGVDAESLRAQLHNEQQAELESKQPPRAASPNTVRSMLRRPLGKSTSLPAFHDDTSRSAAALIAVHPSSLSSMLAASRTTKDQLVSALPSAAHAFDLADGAEGGKPQPDYFDQRVIEALTLPAHKLCLSEHFTSNAKTTQTTGTGSASTAAAPVASSAASSVSSSSAAIGDSIATSLASMLSPFRLGSDWSAGRGIVIPNYDEGPGGSDLLAAIQRSAVERSRKRIQADANHAEQIQTTAGGAAAPTPATQNRDQPTAGRKDPRAHRRTESSTPQSLALQGAMPPSRSGSHNVYSPPGVYLSDRGGPPLAMLTRLHTPQARSETPPQSRPHVQLKALPLHLVH